MFSFGERTLLKVFDSSESEDFRIFFIDTETNRILESNLDYFQTFFFRKIKQDEIALVSKLIELNNNVISIGRFEKLPLGIIVKILINSISSYINDVDFFDLSINITDNFLGIWEQDEISKEFFQIFPEDEEIENEKEDEKKRSDDEEQESENNRNEKMNENTQNDTVEKGN